MTTQKRTSKAAVLTGPREIRLEEFPLPDIGADQGLMRIEACGVCASDVPWYKGDYGGMPLELPVILGHEIVGRVEEVGDEAAARWAVQPGDRIIVERWIPCGHCERCYAGDYRLCVPVVDGHRRFYGGAPTTLAPSLWGGYAEHLFLDASAVVYKVASHVPAEQVPLFTPIANAVSWVTKLGGAGIGSNVFIEGPGQEGLAAVVVAKAAGAARIIVSGLPHDAARLKVCEELGATHTVVLGEEDPVEVIREATDGRMADVVLDVTSTKSMEPIRIGIDAAAVGGTLVCPSFHGEGGENLSTAGIAAKTLTLRGAYGRDRASVFAAIQILESGEHPIDKLTTHHFPLEDVDLALRMVAREEDVDPLHVSIVPS